MHIPDRIIVVGGLPRTGKTILRNTLGSHSQIAFTPTALNFFYWFSREKCFKEVDFKKIQNFLSKKIGLAKSGESKLEFFAWVDYLGPECLTLNVH